LTVLSKTTEFGSAKALIRRGFTVIEATIAAAMLAMLLASSMQMVRLVSAYQRTADRRIIALEAVQSVSDQIANIPWDKLTAASATTVSIPKPLQPYLPAPALRISLSEEATPVPSKQLRVELAWRGSDGQPVAPVRLTTWIYPELRPPK
jgi:hypothetical protein